MRGSLFILVLMLFLLSDCGRIITPTPVATPTVQAEATFTPLVSPTPGPATPAPTFTPMITPTPIIYVVQRGDTLLDIAFRYGVSAEAIQEANGILDPRRLQIGQELLIPQDEEFLARLPTPTPTPAPYAIENVGLYETPVGSLWFLGEVHNITTADIERVQVAITLQDENGETLATATAFTALDIIPSAGRAPFAVLFTHPPATFATYQAVALAGVVVSRLGSAYRDLTVTGHRGEAESAGAYTVEGEVVNVGQYDAEAVTVVITAYDAEGRVVGVRAMDVTASLLPAGGRVSFRANIFPAEGQIVTHTVQVQGQRVK